MHSSHPHINICSGPRHCGSLFLPGRVHVAIEEQQRILATVYTAWTICGPSYLSVSLTGSTCTIVKEPSTLVCADVSASQSAGLLAGENDAAQAWCRYLLKGDSLPMKHKMPAQAWANMVSHGCYTHKQHASVAISHGCTDTFH